MLKTVEWMGIKHQRQFLSKTWFDLCYESRPSPTNSTTTFRERQDSVCSSRLLRCKIECHTMFPRYCNVSNLPDDQTTKEMPYTSSCDNIRDPHDNMNTIELRCLACLYSEAPDRLSRIAEEKRHVWFDHASKVRIGVMSHCSLSLRVCGVECDLITVRDSNKQKVRSTLVLILSCSHALMLLDHG